MDTFSHRHLVFALLLVTNLLRRTVYGQQQNESLTTESKMVEFTTSVPCTEPCENCTSWGECTQRCPPNTIYVENTEATEPTTAILLRSGHLSVGFAKGDIETDSESVHPQCQSCSLHVQHCHECHGNQTHPRCDKCADGYSLSDERTCTPSSSSGVEDWVIAVAVVLSVLGLAVATVAIVYLVRRYRRNAHRPPHIPDPGSV